MDTSDTTEEKNMAGGETRTVVPVTETQNTKTQSTKQVATATKVDAATATAATMKAPLTPTRYLVIQYIVTLDLQEQ